MIRSFFILCLFISTSVIAQTVRLMPPLGHTDAITAFDFSKDGRFLVTGGEDKTVNVWDINTGKILQHFSDMNAKIRGARFHPDSRSVIATSDDGQYIEWDIYSGEIKDSLSNAEGMASCAISNDGKYSAIVFSYRYTDPEIILYDRLQKKIIKRKICHSENIHRLVFTKDGRYLISASYDNSLKMLDANTLAEKGSIKFPKSLDIEIKSFSIDEKSKTLLLVHRSKGMMFYSYPELKLKKSFNPEDAVYYASYSHDGTMIATASSGGRFTLWNAATLKVIKTIKSADPNEMIAIDYAVFDNTNTRIFTVSGFVGFGKMYERISGRLLYGTNSNSTSLASADFSLGGVLIATGSADGFGKIWGGTTGRFLYNLRGHESMVSSAKFGFTGDVIATGSWDETAKIWDWSKKKLLKSIKVPGEAEHVELSRDNKKLITQIFRDSFVYVWDVNTSKLLYKLPHNDYAEYACFSFNGKYIATAARDDMARVWDAATGRLMMELKGHEFWVKHVSFSLNNDLLVSASYDSTAKVWDLASGKCIATLKGHGGAVYTAVFNQDNGFVLTASQDKTAKFWEVASGKCIATITGHTDELISASISSYDEKVMTLSKDHSFKIWSGKTGELLSTSYAIGTNDFFTVTPDGYFFCSPAAARKLHYVTKELKSIPFDQLDLKYNRPDIVMERLGYRNAVLIRSYKNAYLKRLKKAGLDSSFFTGNVIPPTAEIVNAATISPVQTQKEIALHIRAADENQALARLNIWVNEVPMFGMSGLQLKQVKKIDTTISIALSDSINIIEASVINVGGTESYRSPVTITYLPKTFAAIKTYFIGIGVNEYAETGHDLQWSVKDIRNLSQKLKEKYGNTIEIDTLFNQNVTRSNVLSLRNKLLKMGINDRVIFAFSGHGLLSKNFDYYLATYKVDFENPESNGEGLLYDDLEKMFDGIAPRKKLMLIDACHSGELDKDDITMEEANKTDLESKGIKGVSVKVRPSQKAGSANSFELLQHFFANVSRGTGTTVISAAAGTQYALERGDIQNGVFTYSIIEAMNTYPSINVQFLKRYVTSRVVELTNGLQRPNARTETNITDWRVW